MLTVSNICYREQSMLTVSNICYREQSMLTVDLTSVIGNSEC